MPGAVQTALDTFGAIDLPINNAGVSQRSLCEDTEMAVYQKLMDVDVMGQIALTKAVLPHMLERGSGHMAETECADVVFKGLTARKREIPVGKGKEMAALWIKRVSPKTLFRITRTRS